MSEQKDVATKKAARKPRDKKTASGGDGGIAAFLAMLVALIAAGGSYYIWQQHLIAVQNRLALERSVAQLLEAVEQKDLAQQKRIDALAQHKHNDLEQHVVELENLLPELTQQLSMQQQDWNYAEIDYLLRIAEHRIHLSRDIPTALAALTQAREQLERYGKGQYPLTVAAIDSLQTQIGKIQQTGSETISSQIQALLLDLEAMPFAIRYQRTVTSEEKTPPPVDGDMTFTDRFKQWGSVVWDDLKSLVTIRRSDEISRPLMNPEQRFFLQTQLRLKLETARLAAISHNHPLYQASLQEAASWINQYYDGGNQQVMETATAIAELSLIQVDPQLPSLKPIRQQLHDERPLPATPVDEAAPQAAEESVQPKEIPVEPAEQPAAGSSL